ncbi:MAG: hypothetical protein M1457_11670 [bacterium]|nr:hypothetical protein [bacterium]
MTHPIACKTRHLWRRFLTLLLLGVLGAVTAPPAHAVERDFGQDVQIDSTPSPRDMVTDSSINQYGRGQTNSQIDNYIFQNEQLNLDPDSGILRVLRTNQKALVNGFVTALVPLKHANPRELRGLARTICRKEGGDADVLQDKVSGKNYLAIVCPDWQIPYVMKTLAAIDQDWISEVEDGSMVIYYPARHRDARDIANVIRFYASPDSVREIDDANNAILFFDQPCLQKLIEFGLKEIDVPPNQMTLDVAVYEVDTQNDLALGLDFESWKNSAGRNLFDFVFWDFDHDAAGMGLFPGTLPTPATDWGHVRSYNVLLTTAYLDFLQAKGKARLMNKATLVARSGSSTQLAAVDQFATFESSYDTAPEPVSLESFHLFDIYDYYYKSGAVALSAEELVKLPVADAVGKVDALLASIGADEASRARVRQTLTDKGSQSGVLTLDDLHATDVSLDVVLEVFRDRMLTYRKSSQPAGLLLSVLPVVGQLSSEVAVALDVSDVTGLTPAGLPVLSHRYFSSAVEVKDGQPFVLGGIRKTEDVKTSSGMPFLREIPWLGYLFSREVTTKREKEVIVVMTPRFTICPAAAAQPPEEIVQLRDLAQGKDVPVPESAFGFDQWLLDKAKQ